MNIEMILPVGALTTLVGTFTNKRNGPLNAGMWLKVPWTLTS